MTAETAVAVAPANDKRSNDLSALKASALTKQKRRRKARLAISTNISSDPSAASGAETRPRKIMEYCGQLFRLHLAKIAGMSRSSAAERASRDTEKSVAFTADAAEKQAAIVTKINPAAPAAFCPA